MYRFKTIFSGDLVATQSMEVQMVQISMRCKALNTMTALGMPDSYTITARSSTLILGMFLVYPGFIYQS